MTARDESGTCTSCGAITVGTTTCPNCTRDEGRTRRRLAVLAVSAAVGASACGLLDRPRPVALYGGPPEIDASDAEQDTSDAGDTESESGEEQE